MRRILSGLCALALCLGLLPARAAAEKAPLLVCAYSAPVGEGYAGVAAHVHTAACYDADGALLCPLPELAPHIHTDACYTVQRSLICPLEETPGHRHTEVCFAAVRGELLCANESEEHEHSELCYAWTQELGCPLAEGEGAHSHDESCYLTERVLSCGQLGLHVHDESCRDASGALICGLPQMEEHVHGPECFAYPEESGKPEESEPEPEKQSGSSLVTDPTADVESYAEWEMCYAEFPHSGIWDEDLLAVARSQLGYEESRRNIGFDSEWYLGGYTRYGAWYGRPYSAWCAMFISFCLHYAEVPEEAMPRECGVRRWIDELDAREQYAAAGEYLPKSGDLVFFDFDADGLSDHVGLVETVAERETEVWQLETIEGNRTPAVERFRYALTDETILGYGILPAQFAEAGESEAVSMLLAIRDETESLSQRVYETLEKSPLLRRFSE